MNSNTEEKPWILKLNKAKENSEISPMLSISPVTQMACLQAQPKNSPISLKLTYKKKLETGYPYTDQNYSLWSPPSTWHQRPREEILKVEHKEEDEQWPELIDLINEDF